MSLDDYLEDSPGSGLRVFDPEVVPHDLGPLLNEYFMTSSAFQEKRALVKSMLYEYHVVPVEGDEYARNLRFIPGGTMNGSSGPKRKCQAVIIGRIPTSGVDVHRTIDEDDDVATRLLKPVDYLLGDNFDVLVSAFKEVGIPEHVWGEFYVTNMVRFPRPTHSSKGGIRVAWVKEGLHLLHQELGLLDPDYILCMGTEASKHFTGYSITKAQSHIFSYKLFTGKEVKVICTLSPVEVIANFERRPQFVAGVSLFADTLLKRKRKERVFNHFEVSDAVSLEAIVDELIKSHHREFTVDCEWGGEHFMDKGAGLRTIQVGWNGTDAIIVVLRRCGMREAFTPYISSAILQLQRLLLRPDVKIIGHNILADFHWLHDIGLDITAQLYFDTMLAAHLFEPTASHGLEDIAVKIIPGWHKHDMALEAYKKSNPIKDGEGYGNVPDEILHPYAGYDVNATFMIYQYYKRKFAEKHNEGLRVLFNELIMPAIPALAEIERNGVCIDMERAEETRLAYKAKRDELLGQFREIIGRPDFNPNSSAQKADLLFKQLELTPVKTTGKYPMMWDEVVFRGEEKKHSPAADGETLDMLAHKSMEASMLRDICLLSTILQNFLPEPVLDPVTGLLEHKKGITAVKSDGRLRTRIGQMIKTGRLASSDPNLMNMPNKQEAPIENILGNDGYKLRGCFIAEEGSLLISSDYKQAEIAALAYLSGDERLIAAVKKGEDIHSIVGIQMFDMEDKVSIKEFKTNHKHLRIAAKSIVFGDNAISLK